MSLGLDQFRSRIVPILLAWPFVAALVVLITNDLYLKLAYPGWLTGKLSDFSGVYLIAALAIGLFPKRKFLAAAIPSLQSVRQSLSTRHPGSPVRSRN
jgi:hypothetical protein